MSVREGFRQWMLAGAVFASALLSGCGSGGSVAGNGGGTVGGTQSCGAGSCGTAMLSLADAAGDFSEYSVDISSLKLVRADGTTVETLPATTRVDLTQVVDLNELISARQIPPGNYVSATVSVDYSHAEILADDGNGGSVSLAPVDANGNAIGSIDLAVKLDNRNHLVITAGRVSRLAFDFDLTSSNSVDLGAGTVTVQPVLTAAVLPPDTRDLRVRGALQSVDAAGSSYSVNVRPFRVASGSHGSVVVHTDPATDWEIDGTTYTGSAGLAQLAMLPVGSWTVAIGSLNSADWSFTASRVLAGTSAVPVLDGLHGVVVARAGNTLSVRGGVLEGRDGTVSYQRGEVALTVADGTRVTKEGVDGTFMIQDISVGQRIFAVGNAGGTSAAPSFDASNGRVRLQITSVWGTVNSQSSSLLALNLLGIEGRRPGIFDFSGTGVTPADDADPANYQVATGALPMSGYNAGEVARVFGFVRPFGSAHPDFDAITAVDYSGVRAVMAIGWTASGTTTPFTQLGTGSLTANLDPAAVGVRHALKVGPLVIDLLNLPASPTIVPDMSGGAVHFAIAHARSHSIDNFDNYADFLAALTTDLNGTTVARSMLAAGHYAALGNTFTAVALAVVLED